MPANLRPTLRQVFAFSLLGLVLSLALLFYLVFHGSQRTILQSSERFRDAASRDVGRRVTAYLNEAPMAVAHFEMQVQFGIIDPKKPDSAQAGLLSLLLANENISEASLTYADKTGFDTNGNLQINPASAGEVTVARAAAAGQFVISRTRFDGAQFVSASTLLAEPPVGTAPAVNGETPAADPTSHLTFQTPASQEFYGQLLWTDLHWSQLDAALPANRRRVEVSVQKAIGDAHAQFAGVLRVGLMKDQIDRAVQLRLSELGEPDPHLIFLCDNQGRLITALGRNDRVVESADDLRITSSNLPPQIAAALAQPVLKKIGHGQLVAATDFRSGATGFLCTFRALPATQDWIIGIVVPRDYYLGSLLQIRREVLWASLALIAVIIAGGSLVVHGVGRAHALILRETSRMKAFEFSASPGRSRLHDIADVLTGLEKAKTAMRAISKYVPVDLVKRLYHDGREPVLGGEAIEISVLFTDIRGFTPFAEQTEPDKMAEILGRYLNVMATVIQSEKGTIDKYIGDAVMAFWNAPETVADHAILACGAALKCREVLRDLYDSPDWQGAPRFETRFGLHRCTASVGHFGSPDRFNYTAIGDGINLTSRLEGLNDRYGTAIIVSESIQSAARGRFEFRLLDRVAVRGKLQGVTIYELVAERMPDEPRPARVLRYEQAFAACQRREFKTALAQLEAQPEDPPSLVLAERCRRFLESPPPPDWNGIYMFDTK